MSESVIQNPVQRWRCKRGHEYSATTSFDITFKLDGRAVAKTADLCVVCLADFLKTNFPIESVGLVSAPEAAPVEAAPAPAKKSRKKTY
jgi:hypothetical protein